MMSRSAYLLAWSVQGHQRQKGAEWKGQLSTSFWQGALRALQNEGLELRVQQDKLCQGSRQVGKGRAIAASCMHCVDRSYAFLSQPSAGFICAPSGFDAAVYSVVTLY